MSSIELPQVAPEMARPIPPILETYRPGPASPDEEREFTELYQKFADQVIRAASWAGSQSPEDTSQEVFGRLWRKRDDVYTPGSSWFNTTTRREVCDEWRRGQRRPAKDWFLDPSEVSGAAPDAHAVAEQRAIIGEALSRIPNKLREVIVMCDLKDTPVKEVAEALGIPEGTVKSRATRARSALRVALGDMGIASLDDIL